MTEVVILQRVVPHYRLPLFRRLWEEFGWRVVTASNPPAGTNLHLFEGASQFVQRFEFRFPDPSNPTRCHIPVGRVLTATGARAIISEFALRMRSTYELIGRNRSLGRPVTLFWSHGYNMDRGLGQPIMQWPRGFLSALADGHICYSEEGREFLARFMPRDRLFVAHNTIDVVPLQAVARSVVPKTAPGRPHLLTVGRLTQDKDFPRLVRIFHRLRANFPDAALTVIGDGPDADPTRAAAGDQLARSIHMVGALYDEAVLASHFLSADLVVFPGAVGLSVNHALAYGVPVAAYDRMQSGPHHHPEIAYVVDGVTGLRVSPYTEDAMLGALQAFLGRHPDPRSEFRERIDQYVSNNLTLDAMVDDFRDVEEFIRRRLTDRDRQ